MQRYTIFFIAVILLILPLNLHAASIHYSSVQLESEQTFIAYDGDFSLKIPYGLYSSFDAYVFKKSASNLPTGLNLAGQVFDYYLMSPEITDDSPFNVTLKYELDSISAKNIYKWNWDEKIWELQPSIINTEEKTVSTIIKGRKGKVAVFENIILELTESEINYNGQFYVSLPDALADIQTTAEVKSFSSLGYLEEKARESNIYQFDIKSKTVLDLSEPIKLTIKLSDSEATRKAIYYWDNNQASWMPLPSWTNYYDGTVSAYTHLPFSRVALFEEPEEFVGEASWYAWKGGNYAASRDYPKGTQLKVVNITKESKNFGKSVIVTINDYGPELWTGRIIDLDKVAYGQIGYVRGGTMAVRVEEIDD